MTQTNLIVKVTQWSNDSKPWFSTELTVDDYVGDIGELYEAIKFHADKNHSGTLEVKLKPEVQY